MVWMKFPMTAVTEQETDLHGQWQGAPPPWVFSPCAPQTLMFLLSNLAPCSLSVFLLCAPTLDTVSLVAFLLSSVDKWLFLLPLFVVFNDFF